MKCSVCCWCCCCGCCCCYYYCCSKDSALCRTNYCNDFRAGTHLLNRCIQTPTHEHAYWHVAVAIAQISKIIGDSHNLSTRDSPRVHIFCHKLCAVEFDMDWKLPMPTITRNICLQKLVPMLAFSAIRCLSCVRFLIWSWICADKNKKHTRRKDFWWGFRVHSTCCRCCLCRYSFPLSFARVSCVCNSIVAVLLCCLMTLDSVSYCLSFGWLIVWLDGWLAGATHFPCAHSHYTDFVCHKTINDFRARDSTTGIQRWVECAKCVQYCEQAAFGLRSTRCLFLLY